MKETHDIPFTFGTDLLPAEERILWQGRPAWSALALDACHLPGIAAYFLVLAFWRVGSDLHDGATRLAALADAAGLILPACACLGLGVLYGWLAARATTFTITNRRLLMRYGVALPALLNIPLDQVEAVRVRVRRGGAGDIAFTLPDTGRLSFHQLWPYARPWRPYPAEPMLRAIPDAERVGAILLGGIREATGTAAGIVPAAHRPEPAAAPVPAAA